MQRDAARCNCAEGSPDLRTSQALKKKLDSICWFLRTLMSCSPTSGKQSADMTPRTMMETATMAKVATMANAATKTKVAIMTKVIIQM